MTSDPPIPRVPKKPWPIFGRSEERDELCIRLGIDPELPEHMAWALIGIGLAPETDEFSRRRKGRGRPKREVNEAGIDYQRTKRFRALKREMQASGEAGPYSIPRLVQQLIDQGDELFQGKDFDSLRKSVSKGNTEFKQAIAEIDRRLLDSFRVDCENFRKRAGWLRDAAIDVARLQELQKNCPPGLLAFWGEDAAEMTALEQRLRNPNTGLV